MKIYITLFLQTFFMLTLVNCPTGSNSGSSNASPIPYSSLNLLSQNASNPQALVIDREYTFKLSFSDVFGEVVLLDIELDNTAMKISGEKVTQISDTEYHLSKLSSIQPGSIERYARVTLRLQNTSGLVHLKMTAYGDYTMQDKIGSTSSYYAKEASKPQDIRLDEMFTRYSSNSSNPTTFTTQAFHSIELKITDAARWIHSAKLTLSDENIVLQGKNISGSAGKYLFKDFKLYQNTYSIAYFQLQAPTATAEFNIIIELLEGADQPFSPTISQTFYFKGDEKPSQIFAVHENQELGNNASPTKVNQQMTFNLSFLDPAKEVGAIKLAGTNFQISTVNSGGSLGTQEITSISEANQLGRRTLEMVMTAKSSATNTAEKFSFELLDDKKASFTPPLKKEYYLQKATVPNTLKLLYKGNPVSQTSGSATIVELKEKLSFTFKDPDRLVDSIRLKINNTDFELSGSQVWLDKSTVSENEYLIQNPTLASGIGKDLIIEKGDKKATLNFELKSKNSSSFNPSITQSYYIEVK